MIESIKQLSLIPGAEKEIDYEGMQRKRLEGIRKSKIINEIGNLRGFPIRGRDKVVARQMINLIWKMGNTDEDILSCAKWYLEKKKLNVYNLTFPFLYRNIEAWEVANDGVVQEG